MIVRHTLCSIFHIDLKDQVIAEGGRFGVELVCSSLREMRVETVSCDHMPEIVYRILAQEFSKSSWLCDQ